MLQGSALHKMKNNLAEDRMKKYKVFAAAFIYPDKKFFDVFPALLSKKEQMQRLYDQLFRAKEIWLYGAEYTSKTEFQRASYLSDIMGFYKAFGLDTNKDRPDSLSSEFEFMYYLIYKRERALSAKNIKDAQAKASVCADAQRKFFDEHLYPAAKSITQRIIEESEDNFYTEMADEIIEFLESEKCVIKNRF